LTILIGIILTERFDSENGKREKRI